MNILVADDDLLSRRLLENVLSRAGYQVTAVRNGLLAAEQLCRLGGPRLALLDWDMPEMDGLGVCRKIRQQQDQNYVYIVLLTAKEAKSDIVAGLGAGADDYLTKPFDPEELKARLRAGQRILDLEDRLVEAREEMRFKATHDALTGLYNRGVIMDMLRREISRGRRERSSTAILLCDLDRFKGVNDTHGHLTGDEVLRETARRLLGSVRSYDLVGRYGGEEFLLILNNCDPASVLNRAEEIRKSFAEDPMETTAGPMKVTLSLGLLRSIDWEDRAAEALIREVDGALYAAKAAGGNCTKMANPRVSVAVPALPQG
ncbi:MAG: diguanylate cyclase [Candidatus Acidiferrum sp.]